MRRFLAATRWFSCGAIMGGLIAYFAGLLLTIAVQYMGQPWFSFKAGAAFGGALIGGWLFVRDVRHRPERRQEGKPSAPQHEARTP